MDLERLSKIYKNFYKEIFLKKIMKRRYIFIFSVFLLIGLLTFAIAENDSLENSTNNQEDEEELLGASCGTVSPGYQDECCQRKGYEGWDEEEFQCIGERERENLRKRIKLVSGSQNQTECPEDCVCSGSTVKCSFGNGTRVMTVYAGNSGNTIVQVKNINASTNVTLYKEDGKVYGNFSGNRTKEIHLPDEIKEKLQNHTRRRLYNESINLTEDGYYQVQTKKRARLFLLIPVRERVRAQVDAETGEIVRIRNPWWGFLARDMREKNASDD